MSETTIYLLYLWTFDTLLEKIVTMTYYLVRLELLRTFWNQYICTSRQNYRGDTPLKNSSKFCSEELRLRHRKSLATNVNEPRQNRTTRKQCYLHASRSVCPFLANIVKKGHTFLIPITASLVESLLSESISIFQFSRDQHTYIGY